MESSEGITAPGATALGGDYPGSLGQGTPGANGSFSSSSEAVLPESTDECTVVKRDGMLVPFRKDRVERAIELAFRATKNIWLFTRPIQKCQMICFTQRLRAANPKS